LMCQVGPVTRPKATVKPVPMLFPASRRLFAGSHKRAGSWKGSLCKATKGKRMMLTRMGEGERL
jgi:hypothetical protein